MNSKAITAEALQTIDKLVSLCGRKVELLNEMRMSMMHHAIKENVARLEVRHFKDNPKRFVIGARMVWDTETSPPDIMLMTLDEFKRVGGREHILPRTYWEERTQRNEWNKCYETKSDTSG